ncbi:PAS domain S-box protein [bacterium]|nr:PAS domain S-box protein [bacterium]
MKRIFGQLAEERFGRAAGEIQLRIIALYAAYGFGLGALLNVVAWGIKAYAEELPWSLVTIHTLHLDNAMLYLFDGLPLIFAALCARLGYVQARLHINNMALEERVRERTMEITLEKARTSAIIDNAADAIVTFDEHGKIDLFNSAAERLFGYKHSEAIQRDIRALIPAFEAVEGARFQEFLAKANRDREPGSTSHFSALSHDGTFFPVEIDISEFHLGDEVSYTAIIRDLTEKRRQERLERSLQHLTEAVNQSQDLEGLYNAIHESLSQVLDVTNFYIALLDPGHETYRIVFSVDELYGDREQRTLPVAKSLVSLLLETRKPLLLAAGDFRRLTNEGRIRANTGRPSVSWLGVPLISKGEMVGLMAVHSHEEGLEYTRRDAWVMNFVSGHIASAIEREHARDELRQSEKRYRRMIEEAGDIVYTTDIPGKFTYVNPPIIRLTGYSESELIGHNCSMLVDDEWRATVRTFYLRQLRAREKESVYEFPIITKQGSRRWIEQTTTLLFEDGRPNGFQSVVHDITERRDVEWALREREERFRSLSSSSPIGVFQVNADGRCIYTNKRWQEITGRGLAESLGEGWLEAIHPKDRQTFKIEWIFSRDEGSSVGREARVLRADGELRWVSIRWASMQDDFGQLTGFVGTFEDITLRKHTEQLNRVLYEISQAAATSADLQDFFRSLHQSLSAVIDTTNLYVALYERDAETISFPYARESGVDLNLATRPVGKGLTGYIVRNAKPLLVDEGELNAMYARGEVTPVGKPTKNWLGVPLITQDGVIGAVILQSYTSDRHFQQEDVQTMTFVSSQIANAIQRKQAEEERRRYTQQLADAHSRIKEDLKLAARIQHSRLPQEKLEIPHVEFGWLFNACEEVAGDMFNFIRLSDKQVGIYILDVSGHGVPAALLSMSLSRSMTAVLDGSGALLREEDGAVHVCSPAEVSETMNRRFPMNLEITQYFTFLYGILDLETLEFSYTRAGHPSPVLIRRGVATELDEALGPAIGIIPDMHFEEASIQLRPGDEVVFYTDGVDEAANAVGEEFGLPRILSTLADSGHSIEADIKRLREGVRQFTGTSAQSDDITIVGFRIRRGLGSAGPSTAN